ncbi:MAG TPA: hypothetical protein VF940_03160 [Streptosporangiaceae bacterium]
MSVGVGTFLITVGAILLFALTAESPSWLNLRVVGVILILAGVLGLAIPGVARARGARFRRWVEPMLPEPDQSPADLEKDLIRRPGANGDSPTLADAMLSHEHDPPI